MVLDGARELLEVALDQQVQAHRIHGSIGKPLASGVKPGPEEGAARDAGLLDVLMDRLRTLLVQPNRSAPFSWSRIVASSPSW